MHATSLSCDLITALNLDQYKQLSQLKNSHFALIVILASVPALLCRCPMPTYIDCFVSIILDYYTYLKYG